MLHWSETSNMHECYFHAPLQVCKLHGNMHETSIMHETSNMHQYFHATMRTSCKHLQTWAPWFKTPSASSTAHLHTCYNEQLPVNFTSPNASNLKLDPTKTLHHGTSPSNLRHFIKHMSCFKPHGRLHKALPHPPTPTAIVGSAHIHPLRIKPQRPA